jgi:hypothetical protein
MLEMNLLKPHHQTSLAAPMRLFGGRRCGVESGPSIDFFSKTVPVRKGHGSSPRMMMNRTVTINHLKVLMPPFDDGRETGEADLTPDDTHLPLLSFKDRHCELSFTFSPNTKRSHHGVDLVVRMKITSRKSNLMSAQHMTSPLFSNVGAKCQAPASARRRILDRKLRGGGSSLGVCPFGRPNSACDQGTRKCTVFLPLTAVASGPVRSDNDSTCDAAGRCVGTFTSRHERKRSTCTP